MTRNRSESPSTLIADGVAYASGRHKSRSLLLFTAERLSQLSASDRLEAKSTIVAMIDRAVDIVFEHGWLPAEIMHAGRRAVDQSGQQLLVATIGAHAHRWSASMLAPRAWATQLSEIGVDVETPGDHIRRWETAERAKPVGLWVAMLSTLGFVSRLPPLAPSSVCSQRLVVDAPPGPRGSESRG